MKKTTSILAVLLLAWSAAFAQEDFQIDIKREKVEGGLIYGKIYVNNDYIGDTYENEQFKIPAESYKGIMRYKSARMVVQGPLGVLSHTGDFLIQLSGIYGYKGGAILLHQGNKPEHADGCIMLGPANKGPNGSRSIEPDHPLYKLRVLFYGSAEPNSSPNKNIKITIYDPEPKPEPYVKIFYGSSYPYGVKFQYAGTTYTFKPGETVSLTVKSVSGETVNVWECPTNQTCRWSSFKIYPGNNYTIIDSGNGRGLALKKR